MVQDGLWRCRQSRGMKRKTQLPIVGLLALLPLAAWAQEAIPEVEFNDPGRAREYLEAYVGAPGGPPSISLAVAVGGEIVLAEAVGIADLETGRLATPTTPYRTYSISKGITAVAVMQAVERGELDLDEDIRDFLPAFPEKRWTVRLIHLLTHTSGVRHYKENAGEISSTIEYPTLSDSLAVFAADPLGFEPGTAYRYTSFGFNMLTGALERVTGDSFGEVLAERVFGPAGMVHSSLADAKREIPGIATAYWAPRMGRHRRIDELPNVSGKYGSSGVVSTPSDLVRLFLALDDCKLMSAETSARMIEVTDPEVADGQALGWNAVVENGRRVVYRTGAGTGYTGIVEYFPDHGVAGAVLINQNQYKGRVPILERVLEYYLDQLETGS